MGKRFDWQVWGPLLHDWMFYLVALCIITLFVLMVAPR